MLKKLYDRCLYLASHKLSKKFLAFISFIESSFFPIPPDVMIIPMVMARKEDYLKIFLLSTFFSVLGGLFGYLLGSLFFDFSLSIIEFYNYEDKVYYLQEKLSNNEGKLFWLVTLFLAGFTPLPYKVFTITSGIIGFNLPLFIVISLVSRGLRFFIVSYFTMKFGQKFIDQMSKDGSKYFFVSGVLLVLIAIVIYIILK